MRRNHSYSQSSSITTTTITQALFDKTYTYLRDYPYNYKLDEPSYNEVNNGLLEHRIVRKRRSPSRKTYALLNIATVKAA